MKLFERRYDPEAAKFATQFKISLYVVFLTASVICFICWNGQVSDAKEIYNTLLPIFAGVVGYWIGASKGQQDTPPSPRPGTTTVTPPSNVTITTKDQEP